MACGFEGFGLGDCGGFNGEEVKFEGYFLPFAVSKSN